MEINKNFEHKIVNIFVCVNFNICFGCSKESSHRDGSFEYPQLMFWLRNKKNNYATLSEACCTVNILKLQFTCPFETYHIYDLVSRAQWLSRVLDWGSKGCGFQPYRRRSHCVVSLSKTLYLLLSTDSTQEDPSRHD